MMAGALNKGLISVFFNYFQAYLYIEFKKVTHLILKKRGVYTAFIDAAL
jgi:hypothetical protein